MDENESAGCDWSDRVRNVAITAVQVATLLLIAEHAGWKLRERLGELRKRWTRWQREQEFELYYQRVWRPALERLIHKDAEEEPE